MVWLHYQVSMGSEYVEERNGGYYMAGTRISLESVICGFQEGLSPEAIQEELPLLKRSQIYGAIAFYLDHQIEMDRYMAEAMREFEGQSIPLADENPELWARLQRARAKVGESRP
jgi:uncharacterized protein (DUF433 family)